jgi:hypothetical protein
VKALVTEDPTRAQEILLGQFGDADRQAVAAFAAEHARLIRWGRMAALIVISPFLYWILFVAAMSIGVAIPH